MHSLGVTERTALSKACLGSVTPGRTEVGRLRSKKYSTEMENNIGTGTKRIQQQTQEYDYFGKKPSRVFPRMQPDKGTLLPSSSVNSFSLSESDEINSHCWKRIAASEGENRKPEYRVMNPMFRISREYSTLSSKVGSRKSRTQQISILVVDEGGEFRSRIAAAMLMFLLGKLREKIPFRIDVASIGPPTLGEVNDSSATALSSIVKEWMNNDEKALELVRQTPREFHGVKDPVEHDLILVMDKYDLKETLREVSILDAISPGNNYSCRVKRITPFSAHVRDDGSKLCTPFPLDIPDPLYFPKDLPLSCSSNEVEWTRSNKFQSSPPREAQNIDGLSRDLAFCCKGVVDMLRIIHYRVVSTPTHRNLKPRDVLHQILRCPGLWMEYPYGRMCIPATHRSQSQNYWTMPSYVGKISGERNAITRRNIKAKGYWKVLKNVERELDNFMKENRMTTLPTQAMLRKNGKHSLASSIDYHGGLSVFASKLGLNLHKRRPNGFWSNFESLKREITQFIENEPGVDEIMPTAQDLVRAGRSDLVRAIRMHGGFSKVALSIGIMPHRSSHHWEEVGILSFLQTLKKNGYEISRHSIRESKVAGLESAIDRLGGFPYFNELLEDSKESCALYLTKYTGEDNNLLSSEQPACEHLTCPAPYIERVAKKLCIWMEQSNIERDRLPTKRELVVAGRLDIWRSIQRAGGLQKMSEYLHVPYKETRGRKAQHEVPEMKQNLLETWNAYDDFVLID